ncbi:MAG: hypothetical protein AB7N71_03050 [Phycisphaerae bacterium]
MKTKLKLWAFMALAAGTTMQFGLGCGGGGDGGGGFNNFFRFLGDLVGTTLVLGGVD